MLSKKMAFSLMSLITLLAFVFVAPSAMAGDFGTTMTVEPTQPVENVRSDDISHADGIQLQATTAVTLKVKFDQVVALTLLQAQAKDEEFTAADILVQTYTEDGALTEGVAAIGDIGVGTPADGKNFTVLLTSIDEDTYTLSVQILKEKVGAASAAVGDDDDANALGTVTVTFLEADAVSTGPEVLKIARVGEPFVTVTSATFDVHVLLSEDAKGGLVADLIDPGESTVSSVVKLASPAVLPMVVNEVQTDVEGVEMEPAVASWRDDKLHLYLVTLATKPGEKTVVIKIKNFAGNEMPTSRTAQQMYIQAIGDDLVEGRYKLTVKTNTADPKAALGAGFEAKVGNETRIPSGGFLVVATNVGESGVKDNPENDKDEPLASARTPAQLLYNAVAVGLPNLEGFLNNGGTIDLVSPTAGLVISEIMWGSDASLDVTNNSQWIEIHNPGASLLTGDGTTKFVFYGANETLPDMSVATNNIQDRVGTIGAGGHWSLAGKGQSGRSGEGEAADNLAAVIPTQAIISMQRAIDATGVAADGTMASSWTQSTPPAVNFDAAKVGVRIASPGAAPIAYPVAPVVVVPPVAPTVPAAAAGDIVISEIMVDTGNGRLPQWVELHNVSASDASLKGWDIAIEDAQGSIVYPLGNVTVDAGQTALVVSETTNRNSGIGTGEGDLRADRIVNLDVEGALIDAAGFKISLIVPVGTTGGRPSADIAGNLGADWDTPMAEGDDRSSLIRKYDLGVAGDGTMAASWVLAAETALVGGHNTFYGDSDDMGTPGYRSGGPLPVELSHFRPARDKETGAVVITWLTQSELNNAGFFIKRSQQRDGEFKIINAAMIQGAGTTSEKQFYTYTDTTAQPNVVYYYQIEDVSLDGNHQTLTNGIRLKGHIGAAGKLTTLWGDLKTSQ